MIGECKPAIAVAMRAERRFLPMPGGRRSLYRATREIRTDNFRLYSGLLSYAIYKGRRQRKEISPVCYSVLL